MVTLRCSKLDHPVGQWLIRGKGENDHNFEKVRSSDRLFSLSVIDANKKPKGINCRDRPYYAYQAYE